MKLMTERCCAANDSMFLLPSWSVSPNAYCALLVENKMRASTNVIQPRSAGGNADKDRASVASVVPSSFVASGGAGASAPNSHAIRLIIPILALLRRPRFAFVSLIASAEKCPFLATLTTNILCIAVYEGAAVSEQNQSLAEKWDRWRPAFAGGERGWCPYFAKCPIVRKVSGGGGRSEGTRTPNPRFWRPVL